MAKGPSGKRKRPGRCSAACTRREAARNEAPPRRADRARGCEEKFGQPHNRNFSLIARQEFQVEPRRLAGCVLCALRERSGSLPQSWHPAAGRQPSGGFKGTSPGSYTVPNKVLREIKEGSAAAARDKRDKSYERTVDRYRSVGASESARRGSRGVAW